MLSVLTPLRKEHPSLLLERGGPGMQQSLIGQQDLWSLRVAIPTPLWFLASRSVKCRVELVARGGPGARGNPGSASRGGVQLPIPQSWLVSLDSLVPRISRLLLPTSPCNFAARKGPVGLHSAGGLIWAPRSLSELAVSFCKPKP